MYGKNFDMIYNSKMFANKEFLYQHIIENMVLNNRGEEFGSTLILTKDKNLIWDIMEGIRKIKNIEIKDNSWRSDCSTIIYQYIIPRTDKISVNKIEILHYDDNRIEASDYRCLRGYRYRTLILDVDKDTIKNMNKEIWEERLLCSYRPIENNYTDAKIFIY